MTCVCVCVFVCVFVCVLLCVFVCVYPVFLTFLERAYCHLWKEAYITRGKGAAATLIGYKRQRVWERGRETGGQGDRRTER